MIDFKILLQFWRLRVICAVYTIVSAQPTFATLRANSSPEESLCNVALDRKSSIGGEFNLNLSDRATTLYTQFKGLQGRILPMTSKEYAQAASRASIPVDAILILDRIDLEIDLPLVAGVIVSRPLVGEENHFVDICKSMKIPLAFVKGAYSETQVRQASLRDGYYQLDTSGLAAQLIWSKEAQDLELPSAELPLPINLSSKPPMIVRASDNKGYPRELVGDKFFPLSRLYGEEIKHFQPPMSSLTTAFFEEFMTHFSFDGVSLADIIAAERIRLENTSNTDEETEILQTIQNSIENAITSKSGEDQMNEVFRQLKESLGLGPKDSLSLRSNNDIEDLIAAGLYRSVRISAGGSVQDFVAAVKQIYSSMFTPRAYQIRKRRGLIEKNLRMPILAHAYFDDVDYHATASVEIDRRTHRLIATVNLIEGSDSFATNPSDSSKLHQFKLTSSRHNPSSLSLFDLTYASSGEEFVAPVKILLSNLSPSIRKHLLNMAIKAKSIGLEFAGKQKVNQSDHYEHALLQYKHKYDSKTSAEILNGNLLRSSLDDEFIDPSSSDSLVDFAKNFGATPLHRVTNRHFFGDSTRYALVRYRGKHQIITWNHGEFHADLKSRILRNYPNVKWIRSGLLKSPEPGILQFSQTTIPLNDAPLGFNQIPASLRPRSAFREAIKNAYDAKESFSQLLETQYAIWFQTPLQLRPDQSIFSVLEFIDSPN